MHKRIAITLVVGGILIVTDALAPNALQEWALALLVLMWGALPFLPYVFGPIACAIGVASLIHIFRKPAEDTRSTER